MTAALRAVSDDAYRAKTREREGTKGRFNLLPGKDETLTNHLMAGLLSATALTMAGTATAQTAPTRTEPLAGGQADETASLDEIIVTARRTSERLQDVPIAVSAFSGEQLQRQNILQPQDLQRVAPSLTVTPTARGISTPQYGIRGQRASTPTMLIDPGVGLYFAEVGQSRAGGGNATMYDLESVQVLRGPQGALFGRNNTGGAVLITPMAPGESAEGYVTARIGDYNLRDLEGAANLPLGETLDLRIAGRTIERDGYFRSVTTGQRSYDINNQSLRASLRWTPTEAFTSTLIGTWLDSDEAGSMLKPTAINPIAITNATLRALLQADFDRQQTLGFYENAQGSGAENFRNRAHNRVVGLQNTSTLDLSETLTLKNIIGWRDIEVDYCLDALGTLSHIQRYCGLQDTSQFSNELQLQGDFDNLNVVAGLFYFRESGDEINRNPGVVALSTLASPLSNWVDSEATNVSYAAFVHADYSLSENLSVSAGVRWTRDEREVVWHSRQEAAATGALPRRIVCRMDGLVTVTPSPYTTVADADANLITPDRDLCSFQAQADFSEPTWTLSATYEVTPRNTLYVAHRRGYKSGGFSAQPGNAAAGSLNNPTTVAQREPYLPEIIDDIEFGSKNEFRINGMLSRFNVAAYHGWYTDIQRNSQLLVNNVVTALTLNAASATIWGIEADWMLRVHPSLEFSGGYSLTQASYDEFFNSYNTGTTAAPILTRVDISDARFGFTPEHQLNASVTWSPELSPSIGIPSVSLNFYYQSDFATSDTGSSNCGPDGQFAACLAFGADVDAYSLWNLNASLRDVGGRQGLDLGLFVTNLLDNEHYAFGTPQLGRPFGTFSQGVGAPRMFGLSLRYSWGE